MNATIKQQLDSQKQLILTQNNTMYNMNSQILATLNLINQQLQNQIDGNKNDIRTIQSSITGISGVINNITNVNAVQNNDIQTLKNQQGPVMNSVFWCSMQKGMYSQVTGFCSNSKQCCYILLAPWNNQYQKRCLTSNSETGGYYYQYVSDSQCGTYIYV
ncbi:Hypothetical_protein [Hexamita inflata]|uniref:Hypothetical_protein n=1 Tax=Hexamita inflata TaxID=28002 RepID=A0AA86TT74_9EUKA|nr:Hypothetical protein HINF_LOCUS15734 [Hexamita inflata]